MNRKRIAILLFGVATVAIITLRVAPRLGRPHAGPGLPDLLAYVPRGSTLIAYADVAALRSSGLVQRVAQASTAAKVDAEYADFVRATGFDYQRDLDHVLLAADSGQTLTVAEGRFDRKKIEDYASRSGRVERAGGRDFYVVPSADGKKNISFTFLSASMMALVDGGALEGALRGLPAPLDPAAQDQVSRVAGAPMFALARAPWPSAWPAAGLRSGAGAPLLQSLQWVSLAARPDGEQLLLSAEGECASSSQAQGLAGSLELLRTIARGALIDAKGRAQVPSKSAAAADQALETAQISTDGARVRLRVTLTREMLDPSKQAAPAGSGKAGR